MTEWIPCKERRPDNHYEVIVSIRETQNPDSTIVHEFTSVGRYDIVRQRWEVGNMHRTDVVAWMPLPEPFNIRTGVHMSIILPNVPMPQNCHECNALGICDVVHLPCPIEEHPERFCYDERPQDCPLQEV